MMENIRSWTIVAVSIDKQGNVKNYTRTIETTAKNAMWTMDQIAKMATSVYLMHDGKIFMRTGI